MLDGGTIRVGITVDDEQAQLSLKNLKDSVHRHQQTNIVLELKKLARLREGSDQPLWEQLLKQANPHQTHMLIMNSQQVELTNYLVKVPAQ